MATPRPIIRTRRCSVFSCASKNEPGITYHRFPIDPSRRREWLKALSWKEAQVNERSAVCSKHFRSKEYYPGLNRIFLHAVPSLKLNRIASKDKGKSKPPKKVEPMKGSSKQQPFVDKPSKNGYLKSQSQSKVYPKIKQERRELKTMLPSKKALDPVRKFLISKERPSTWKRNTTADQRMKLAAVNQKFGTRTLPTRSANVCTSNPNSKRRNSSFSDLNKSTVFKPKMTKKSKEYHQTSLPSKITTQSKDEENLVQTTKFRDFSSVALSPKPTNSKSSPETENKSVGKIEDVNNIDKTDDERVDKNESEGVDKSDNENDDKTDTENVGKNDSERFDKNDIENFDKTDCENVDKDDDKKVNKTNVENVDKSDSERVDKNNIENFDKTDCENVDKNDDIKVNKTDGENIEASDCKNVKNATNGTANDIILAKTNNDKFERALNKSDDETNSNFLKKPDEKYVEQANSKHLKKTCANYTESISSNQKTTLKRSCEEKSTYPVNKRKRFKRKRLISSSSQDSSEATSDRKSLDKESKLKTNDRSSRKIGRDKRKPRRPIRRVERVNEDLYTIEKIISEMQNKIQNLERKSCLDEKKIEAFKKALIEQRENDIKLLMDEKENELLLRMDLLYLDYDPQRICRLCLLLVDRKESLTPLFRSYKSELLVPLIKNATGVQIEPEDGMPSGVCDDCMQQIKRIDWIKRRTQKSNDLIKKFVAMKKGLSEISSFSSSTMIDTPDDVFGEELSDTFKIEDVFSLEATTIDLQIVKQEPLSDEEESKPVWYIDSSVVKTDTNSRKCKKCLTLFTNRWSFREHVKFCKNRFQCSECQKRFWNSSLLKRHKQRARACVSERSLRYCQECDMLFRWKHQLLFHIIQHSPVSCEFCGSEFQSVERLRRHFLEKH